MDCQRHDKFADQFRAMFVMNIQVDWSKKLVWNEDGKENGLKECAWEGLLQEDEAMDCVVAGGENADPYYQVSCLSCSTKVAVLNMANEIYHFYGCLESR